MSPASALPLAGLSFDALFGVCPCISSAWVASPRNSRAGVAGSFRRSLMSLIIALSPHSFSRYSARMRSCAASRTASIASFTSSRAAHLTPFGPAALSSGHIVTPAFVAEPCSQYSRANANCSAVGLVVFRHFFFVAIGPPTHDPRCVCLHAGLLCEYLFRCHHELFWNRHFVGSHTGVEDVLVDCGKLC